LNVDILGKHATWIADKAGFSVPEGTKVLVVEITEIGYHEPVSKEKMWPVMGFKSISGGIDEAIDTANKMLDMMGKGHSAVIHASDSNAIAKWGASLPVCRIPVNQPNFLGTTGFSTNLPSTAQAGTGFYSGSSKDHNCTPADLLQWVRVAYAADETGVMGDDIEEAVAANNKYG
jgi:acyl-CoA reductase-like NAD-dependent aldehyde dehydrogenase